MARVTSKRAITLLIKRYADILRKDIKVDAVFLFGSYARGDARPDSDIDLMVLSSDFHEDLIESQMQLMRARRSIDLRIEPHPIKTDMLASSVLFELVSQEALRII